MLYAYKCPKCNHAEEVSKPMADYQREEKCSKCGEVTVRQLSVPAIKFVGSGFYVNDYKKKNR